MSQQQVNAELDREADDRATSVVLRKLEEAGFVQGTVGGAWQSEGPMFCEPTTKAFEFLAGWPSDRGDAALARLMTALEARIEATDDPDEKGKLRRVLESVQEVGQGVMVGVLTKVLTSG